MLMVIINKCESNGDWDLGQVRGFQNKPSVNPRQLLAGDQACAPDSCKLTAVCGNFSFGIASQQGFFRG